ncbi:MAG: class I SAM-dependent methyltransferase [bacterium]|nr:class I SAM-dependent methyltransferase [bacterium]
MNFYNLFLARLFPANSLDTDLRYRHVVRLLNKNGLKEKDTLLEVGSGPAGLTRYLKREITGLDKEFPKETSPFLKPITGSAVKLPFISKSFDHIICLDVIEHLPRQNRRKAIVEMLRVAKQDVILAMPIGKLAQKQDELLQNQCLETHSEKGVLAEHLKYGLPSQEEMTQAILKGAHSCRKKVKIRVYSNTNLHLRKIFMSLYFSASPFKRKLFWLLLPLVYFWKLFNFGECYRKIFVISIL